MIWGDDMKKKAGKDAWYGCEEDCFNCPYHDCLKPAYLMKSGTGDKRFRVCGSRAPRKGENDDKRREQDLFDEWFQGDGDIEILLRSM